MSKLALGEFSGIVLTKDTEFTTYYDEGKTIELPKGTKLSVIAGSDGIIILDGEYTNCKRLYAEVLCKDIEYLKRHTIYSKESELLQGNEIVIKNKFRFADDDIKDRAKRVVEEIDDFYDIID